MFESAPSSFPTAHKHRPVSTKRTISLFPLSLSPFDFHYPYVDPNTIPSIPQRHLFFHSRLSHFSSLHPHLPYLFFFPRFLYLRLYLTAPPLLCLLFYLCPYLFLSFPHLVLSFLSLFLSFLHLFLLFLYLFPYLFLYPPL